MMQATASVLGDELAAMKQARIALGMHTAYLTTAQAVDLCAFEVSEETLLEYPDWVLPRIVKNPLSRRPSYLFDPRDIAGLPIILRQWQIARASNQEAVITDRVQTLQRRDHEALALAFEVKRG